MADESLQNIILPSSVNNILAETTNTKTYKNTTESLVTQIHDKAHGFINSECFIAWVIILISSFVYVVCCGYRGDLVKMLTELFNGKILFSLFILSGVYTLSDYMPDALYLCSKKTTFIQHQYNNDNNRKSCTDFSNKQQYNNNQFEKFNNKRQYRRKLEIY